MPSPKIKANSESEAESSSKATKNWKAASFPTVDEPEPENSTFPEISGIFINFESASTSLYKNVQITPYFAT